MTEVVASPEVGLQRSGSSRWALAAALVLLVLGSLLAAFGVVVVGQGLAYDDVGNMGYGSLAVVIGAVVVAIGLLHVANAIAIWKHRPSARYIGILISLLGALFGAKNLPTAFDLVNVRPDAGSDVVVASLSISAILSGLIFFPYLLALIGLLIGGAQFRGRRG